MIHLYQSFWQKMDRSKWFSDSLYSANKNIWFESSMLSKYVWLYWCVYVVNGKINVTGTYDANRRNRKANL